MYNNYSPNCNNHNLLILKNNNKQQKLRIMAISKMMIIINKNNNNKSKHLTLMLKNVIKMSRLNRKVYKKIKNLLLQIMRLETFKKTLITKVLLI